MLNFNTKKLICITGMDGSGKTTLINLLASQIENVYVANIWDLLKNKETFLPFQSKAQIDRFLCALTPDSRLLFLAHALKFSIDKAFASNKTAILFDSYFYKYFATELTLGADNELIQSLILSFPQPDFVFDLELDLTESAKRKKNFSAYECGINAPNEQNFVHFQQKVKANWAIFKNQNWFQLSSLQTPSALAQTILDNISESDAR